ncbi:MAG: family 20 glycosylhydrolase [Bacteroidota bacterium]|nr:family 20 glycosylhydrolase [Bacteroidota bacterium]
MKRSLFLLLIPVFALSCNQMKQSDTTKESKLSLTWSFRGNNAEVGYHSAAFVLENRGESALSDREWTLYYNQLGLGVLDESVTGNVLIEHINGNLLKITPLDGFSLEPGTSVEIAYRKPGSLILESEAPLHPFMVYDNPEDGTSVAHAIADYSVLPFPSLEKVYPAATGIELPDAAWVYGKNLSNSLLNPGELGQLVPSPVKEAYTGETIVLKKDVLIHYHEGLDTEADYLSEMLRQLTGSAHKMNEGSEKGPGMITLLIDEMLSHPESYQLLATNEDGIVVVGADKAGVFYGIQTLLSQFPPEVWANPTPRPELKTVYISDRPAFTYRGFMLDIARNFIEPDDIKKLIRVMAYYKLNKLHLHMTDDEGWRLEIPSLPELTELGSQRGHTLDEKDHLIPAYGSGPDPNAEGNHGSGYLSREAFIDLLKFADAHHIELIPEINMPGHARAAIYAMEARYDRLMKEGKQEEAEMYRLIDPNDESRYNSAQNFDDNVICVCSEGPYRFFETVIDEVTAMYEEAGLTLNTLHTGGDEVPRGVWEGSPICQTFMKEHPEFENFENLQAYFGSRVFEILEKKNLLMAGWEEIVMKKNEEGRWVPNPDFLGKDILPYVWNSIYENLDLGNRLANAGFPVILCNVNNFYFDLAYTHHPAERGLYWGGFVNTRSAFDFAPFDVFKSTLADKWGNPYELQKDFKGMTRLSVNAYNRIIGLQAELWSETVKGGTMAEYYYLPKLIGFAERAWAGQASWGRISDREKRVAAMDKEWNRFANIVGQREMPRLDYLHGGYNYRLPPPGAVIKEGKLYANIDFPGLSIRYTIDGTEPDLDSPVYLEPVEVTGVVKICAFDTRGRSSRVSVAE